MTGEVEVVAWRWRHASEVYWQYTADASRIQKDIEAGWQYELEPLVPASALEALRADNERLEREKSAALGLVEGHSLTIKSLEATICSQRQRLAKLERDDAAFRADNERLEKEWAKANRERSALWDALLPKHPRCRDCADFDGRCQGDGPPCDPQKRALEAASELKARAERAEASLAGRDAEIAKLKEALIEAEDAGNAAYENGRKAGDLALIPADTSLFSAEIAKAVAEEREACAAIADDEEDAMHVQRNEAIEGKIGGRAVKSKELLRSVARERRVLAEGYAGLATAIRARAQEPRS